MIAPAPATRVVDDGKRPAPPPSPFPHGGAGTNRTPITLTTPAQRDETLRTADLLGLTYTLVPVDRDNWVDGGTERVWQLTISTNNGTGDT